MFIDPVLTRLNQARGLGSTEQDYVLLYAVARGIQARRIVEIGTHRGASGICLLRAALDNGYDGFLWTIDNWQGPEGSQAGAFPRLREAAQEAFREAGIADRVAMLTGNSEDLLPSLFAEVGDVDLVFVDGNHSEAAARRDFELCCDHAAWIIFHDARWASVQKVLGEVASAGWTVLSFPTKYLEGDGHGVGIAVAHRSGA